jgi:hypothetical protein
MKKLFILLLALIFNRGLFPQASTWSKPFAITDSSSDNIHCALADVLYPIGYNYSDSAYAFWEKSVDSTRSEIWYRNLTGMSEPKPILQSDGVHYGNPKILETFVPDTPFWILFETDMNGNEDIYYVKYFIDGRFSSPIPFRNGDMDEKNVNTCDGGVVWDESGKIYFSSLNNVQDFNEPVLLDSGDCSKPAVSNDNAAVWEKTIRDSSKVFFSILQRQNNEDRWSPPEMLYMNGHNTHLSFDNNSWDFPLLCWQSLNQSTTEIYICSFRPFDSSLKYEIIQDGFRDGFNRYEPSIRTMRRATKAKAGFYSMLLAFVLDSVSTEIYGNLGWNEFYNISQNGVPDRNPEIHEFRWRRLLMTWESFVNHHWQLMASQSAYSIGSVAESNPKTAGKFELFQSYPNPFNSSTLIRFRLSETAVVRLTIFDLAGREVETLLDDELQAGEKQISWTPRNIASGVYTIRLETGNSASPRDGQSFMTRKTVFLK